MSEIYGQSNGDLHQIQSYGVSPITSDQPIALIYMPWGGINRGSIALGILKQCATHIGVKVDIHYLNIKFAEMLGLEAYQKVSDGEPLLPEWFFSYVLFGPAGMGIMKDSWNDLMTGKYSPMVKASMKEAGWSEAKCREVTDITIPRYIDNCLTSIDWSAYKVIGFSSTFAQTIPSLLLAKRIKELHPDVKIVLGGANAESEMGLELIKTFDWLDYVVHGEAENSFPKLLRNIFSERYFELIPGVSLRKGSEVIASNNTSMSLKDLNQSPIPDYTDYLKEVNRLSINKTLRVVLSFESSRGCWWGAKAHCTFCGLNGATMAFRKKDPERVYEEIINLAGQYKWLSLDAVDNILDLDYMDTLLPKLAEADLDLSLFYEVKASMTKEEIRRLSLAGVNRIQPGIESLNTEILRLMRKGMTAAQNIQLLKWCFEYGITPSWNILYGFPGEQAKHYSDYPRIIRMLMHLQPPTAIAPVVFERFSPYHFEREKFNLTLKPLGYYKLLYPEQTVDYEKIAYYFEGQWEGMCKDMEEYIGPVRETFNQWATTWEERKIFFNYEKGPNFLTLFDNRPLQPGSEITTRRIRLNEMQSNIYMFCDHIQSSVSIQQMLNHKYKTAPSDEQTQTVLDNFVQHGLMFREGDRYLAVAVRRKKQQIRELNARVL